jgi:hypothetical protein
MPVDGRLAMSSDTPVCGSRATVVGERGGCQRSMSARGRIPSSWMLDHRLRIRACVPSSFPPGLPPLARAMVSRARTPGTLSARDLAFGAPIPDRHCLVIPHSSSVSARSARSSSLLDRTARCAASGAAARGKSRCLSRLAASAALFVLGAGATVGRCAANPLRPAEGGYENG